jgi:hypothetical protein
MRASIQSAEKARQALNKQEFDVADEALKQATDSWRVNELVVRLRPELLAARNAAAAEAAAAAKAAAAASATPVPVAKVEVPPPAPEPVAEEPSRPFLLTPVGAITVLVLIAFAVVGISALRKFRSKPEEAAE